MPSTRIPLVLGMALLACRLVLAQEAPTWAGTPDCRVATPSPTPSGLPAWHGDCKDGFAEGKGMLEWRDAAGKSRRLEGVFAAGQVQGEATLHYTADAFYIGTFKNNTPDGRGYFHYSDGSQYEGGVRMGDLEGVGEMVYVDGDHYKGEFKHDQPDGTGVMSFVLGGRYEGNWKDGRRSGSGKLVYAGLPVREVATVDGRDPNRRYVAPEKMYSVKQDHPDLGHLIPADAASRIPVPPTLAYAELSAEQQAMVNSAFPALAAGDEPPYPLHGPAEFLKFVSQVGGNMQAKGDIRVTVVVGKDGKPVSVRANGLDDPEVRKMISLGAAKVAYKPARCAGQPCEMAYGYNLGLTLN